MKRTPRGSDGLRAARVRVLRQDLGQEPNAGHSSEPSGHLARGHCVPHFMGEEMVWVREVKPPA